MKLSISIAFSLICIVGTLSAQNLVFQDQGLKELLITDPSLAPQLDGMPYMYIDTNEDGEISLEEAAEVINLHIDSYGSGINIHSIDDLAQFPNIEGLAITLCDSLTQINGLGVHENLDYLWIGSCFNMTHIDLSDVSGLSKLRIEDMGNIEYLNLKNNSFPSEAFSLFYSQNIQYACVDSIAAEYDEVLWHMVPDAMPSLDCTTGTPSFPSPEIAVFPNPCSDFIHIDTDVVIKEVQILDFQGKQVLTTSHPVETLDIRGLQPGFYLLHMTLKDTMVSRKIRVQ